MISKLTLLAAVLALVLVFVAGLACDDDEGGNNPVPTPDEVLASSVVSDVLMPMIEALNLGLYISAIPDSGNCGATGSCSTGSALACTDSVVTISFTSCLTVNTEMVGTMRVAGDSTAGGVDLTSLILNGSSWRGGISYTRDEQDCLSQTLGQLTVTTSDYTMLVEGSVEYCEPVVEVNGVPIPLVEMFIDVPDQNRFVTVLNGLLGDPQDLVVSVGPSDSEISLVCTGTFYGGFGCLAN